MMICCCFFTTPEFVGPKKSYSWCQSKVDLEGIFHHRLRFEKKFIPLFPKDPASKGNNCAPLTLKEGEADEFKQASFSLVGKFWSFKERPWLGTPSFSYTYFAFGQPERTWTMLAVTEGPRLLLNNVYAQKVTFRGNPVHASHPDEVFLFNSHRSQFGKQKFPARF